ncbi:MAG: ABC transporter permease [Acidimicrobiia bacterium]
MSLLNTKRKRDIRRQRGQFIAVAVTIGLGVMLFAASYDAYRNLDGSYNATYDRLAFADITVIGVDADFVDIALTIEGVDRAEARIQADLPMSVDEGSNFLGRVIAYPADGQPPVNRIDVTEGTYLDPDAPSSVVIETHMAEQFDIGPGDTVEIFTGSGWVDGTVVGVAVSAEYLWPARDNQDLFPAPGTFGVAFVSDALVDDIPQQAARNDVVITYNANADREHTDMLVTDAAGAAGAADVISRANHPSHSTLLLDVNGFQSLSIMFPVLFMTAAGMAAYVLLTRIVFAQRSVIGTLRASGMGRRGILRHYLSYGVRLGLVAGVVGLIVGMASAFAITGVYTSALDIPDTVRSFHWVTPIIGLAFAVAAGALGAWAPARRAVGVAPAEAMRGAAPEGRGRRSGFERVIPPLRHLRVRWLMILRGLGRNKRRSSATVLGVVLGLVLIMVSWGMIDSITILMDRQFQEVSLQDADIGFATAVGSGSLAPIEAIAGVQSAEVVARVNATVAFGADRFDTALLGYQQGTTMHGFPDGIPAEGVLAGNGLANRLDVKPGDELRLSLPELDVEFTAELVGFLDEPVGTVLYMDRDRFDQIVGAETASHPTVSAAQAKFADGADRKRIIDEIRGLDEVAFVSDSRTLYNIINDFLGFFYAFVGFMLVLGGALAFALMYNAISVNVAERSTEFATMRANGLSHRSVARLIGVENILLTVLGIIPGIVAGYLIGWVFMQQFSVDAFTLEFAMRPTSVVISALAMIAAAGLSLIPAIRKVRRIDLGATVRERAV